MTKLIDMHRCIGKEVFGDNLGPAQRKKLWQVLWSPSKTFRIPRGDVTGYMSKPVFNSATKTFHKVCYASEHIESKPNGCAAVYWSQYCNDDGTLVGPRWVVDVRTEEAEEDNRRRVKAEAELWLSENLHLFKQYKNVPYKELMV